MFDAKNAERETNEARAHGRLRHYLHERLDTATIERHFAAGAMMHHDEACQMALAWHPAPHVPAHAAHQTLRRSSSDASAHEMTL